MATGEAPLQVTSWEPPIAEREKEKNGILAVWQQQEKDKLLAEMKLSYDAQLSEIKNQVVGLHERQPVKFLCYASFLSLKMLSCNYKIGEIYFFIIIYFFSIWRNLSRMLAL